MAKTLALLLGLVLGAVTALTVFLAAAGFLLVVGFRALMLTAMLVALLLGLGAFVSFEGRRTVRPHAARV